MDQNPEPKHLHRLGRLWVEAPIYFITTNVHKRAPLLANDVAVGILQEVWQNAEALYGWRVGAYVVMPDHVHFFCGTGRNTNTPLSLFIGKWKEWTAKHLHRRHDYPAQLWQPEFFDHLLRSEESYTEKWHYVRQNPVRAGLVSSAEDWPYRGTLNTLL